MLRWNVHSPLTVIYSVRKYTLINLATAMEASKTHLIASADRWDFLLP